MKTELFLLGSQLRKLRLSRGETLMDVVHKIEGLSKSQLALIESDTTPPKHVHLSKLCKYYGIKIHEIYLKCYMEAELTESCWKNDYSTMRELIDEMKVLLYEDEKSVMKAEFLRRADSKVLAH